MIIDSNGNHPIIDIHLHSYIWMCFEKFGMDQSTPVAMPMAMKLNKRKRDEEDCYLTI
jgi:hypothetical protein